MLLVIGIVNITTVNDTSHSDAARIFSFLIGCGFVAYSILGLIWAW